LFPGRLLFVKNSRSPAGAAAKPSSPKTRENGDIKDTQGRERALAEILRVLKKDGTAMIADFRHTAEYERYFLAQPHTKVEHHNLGWRFWYGGPHAATRLVKGRRSR
jgi:hypothetical protein